MKECLIKFYQQHKKPSFLEKIEAKTNNALVALSCFIGLPLTLIVLFNCLVSFSSLLSRVGSSLIVLLMLAGFIVITIADLGSAIKKEEYAFKEKIKNLLMKESMDQNIRNILEKIELISFYQMNDENILKHYQKKLINLKEKKVSVQTYEKVSALICNSDLLNSYCEGNQEFIEKTNDELFIMIEEKIEKALLEKEKNLQKEIQSIKSYTNQPKENEIFKKEKALALSL
jgi:hypothetical protein